MSNPIHVAVILGSTREGRLCDTLAAWVAGELDKRHDLTFSLIDPASSICPVAMKTRPTKESTASGISSTGLTPLL